MAVQPVYELLHKSFLRNKNPVNRLSSLSLQSFRALHVDGRNRLSTFWVPTGGIAPQTAEDDGSHSSLIRGGFLRQAYSGVFHLLPLGLRVQEKLERLIDKHMRSIGASKLSLSSITSEELWRQSGRFGANSELLRLRDRKESGFLLSPTHEEEITALASGIVKSYKDLPLRVYQISRKYRDERRPRQGLLRAKEFLMKDLYTFDYTINMALETYQTVRNAYAAFFDELKIPYLVANADSGTMGGNLSHEYHFVSQRGEDHVCSCAKCNYVANEELAEKATHTPSKLMDTLEGVRMWTGISKDRNTLVHVYVPRVKVETRDETIDESAIGHINIHALKSIYPGLDTSIEKTPLHLLKTNSSNDTFQIVRIFDYRVSPNLEETYRRDVPNHVEINDITTHPTTGKPLDLTRIQTGDPCPLCEDGTLTVQRAVEVGHTFHLGARYSEPMNATVVLPTQNASGSMAPSGQVAMQMGCHGIGVSRLIGAIASLLSDNRGLNWPRVVSPFECVIIPSRGTEEDAVGVYDTLQGVSRTDVDIDAILDDRPIKDLGWKLHDADLIGYPVILILGRAWKKDRRVEVQCRRLHVKEDVKIDKLREVVMSILEKL